MGYRMKLCIKTEMHLKTSKKNCDKVRNWLTDVTGDKSMNKWICEWMQRILMNEKVSLVEEEWMNE